MRRKVIITLLSAMMVSVCACGGDKDGYTAEKVTDRVVEDVSETEILDVSDVPVTQGIPENTLADDTTSELSETDDTVESEATDYEDVTIKVGYMPNYGSLWSVGSAMEQGLFDDGVTIELVEFADGPSIIAALEAGDLDVGYIGQGAHKVVINNGLKIFALSHVANADMIISNNSVKELFDLKDKKVGYVPETSSQIILEAALKSEGLTMDDITAMTLEDCGTETFAEALSTGVVDAVAVWSPESLEILESVEGAVELADNMSVPDMPISLSSWICTADYAENNKETLTRFADGLLKGMSYGAKENQDKIAEFVAEKTGVTVDEAYAQRGDADWYSAETLLSAIESGTLETFYQMQQEGFIASGDVIETNVKDYVMIDFMQNVAK